MVRWQNIGFLYIDFLQEQCIGSAALAHRYGYLFGYLFVPCWIPTPNQDWQRTPSILLSFLRIDDRNQKAEGGQLPILCFLVRLGYLPNAQLLSMIICWLRRGYRYNGRVWQPV
jgi:hypothetical protein